MYKELGTQCVILTKTSRLPGRGEKELCLEEECIGFGHIGCCLGHYLIFRGGKGKSEVLKKKKSNRRKTVIK